MPLTASPQGILIAKHVSGDPRQLNLVDGILSTYGTNLFTGSPVQMGTNGTIQAVTGVNDPIFGIFVGCQFSALQRRFVLPYWPAGQAYDAGSMIANVQPINDPGIILVGQTAATVAATARGEGINIAAGPTGSIYTGLSSQALGAPTGATPASFTILDLEEAPNNAWGDPFVNLLLMVQNRQGPVA
jgi:hypothetical protein